jgi:cytoskeletal protein CcmA (bactofilin family)
MFWKNRRKAPPIRSLVGEGMLLTGSIQFSDGLRVDGEVRGDIVASEGPSLLVIGEKARVTGRVSAAHVIINGQVRGPVHSTELLELQPKAQVQGELRYHTLEMHPGSAVQGELRPLRASPPVPAPGSAEKPPLTLAASKNG